MQTFAKGCLKGNENTFVKGYKLANPFPTNITPLRKGLACVQHICCEEVACLKLLVFNLWLPRNLCKRVCTVYLCKRVCTVLGRVFEVAKQILASQCKNFTWSAAMGRGQVNTWDMKVYINHVPTHVPWNILCMWTGMQTKQLSWGLKKCCLLQPFWFKHSFSSLDCLSATTFAKGTATTFEKGYVEHILAQGIDGSLARWWQASRPARLPGGDEADCWFPFLDVEKPEEAHGFPARHQQSWQEGGEGDHQQREEGKKEAPPSRAWWRGWTWRRWRWRR